MRIAADGTRPSSSRLNGIMRPLEVVKNKVLTQAENRPVSVIDTIVFDVDGVLIDVSRSFTRAVKDTITRYVEHTETDATIEQQIAALRRVGGFNNDWDLAYGLIALLRAQKEFSEPGHTPPQLEQTAAETGERGLEMIRALVPPGALPDYDEVHATGNRLYWGSGTDGLHLLERPFVTSEFFDQLRGLGVEKMGLFTGRDRHEAGAALKTLGYTGETPFSAIVTSDEFTKPDPAALVHLARELETKRGVYVGDTGDDLRLVQEYSRSAAPEAPTFASVMIAKGSSADYFERSGADAVLGSTAELPGLLETGLS